MSDILHVWAFDPGETTGWTHLSVHSDGEMGIFSCGETDHLGIGNLLFDNQSLRSAACKKEIETIFVVEKFIMQSKITQSPWSLETTGLVRYFASRYHIPLIDTQKPSEVKNLIKDDVIKRAGLWQPGAGHANDAIRHALFYLIIKRGLLQECLRSQI